MDMIMDETRTRLSLKKTDKVQIFLYCPRCPNCIHMLLKDYKMETEMVECEYCMEKGHDNCDMELQRIDIIHQ